MWPKVFAQLIEILPHVSRLIPMADMFFQSKTASEKANEAALKAMAEGVRTDLSSVTDTHASLSRQLQAQGIQINEIAADTSRTRVAIESYADRTAHLEQQLATLGIWVKSAVALLLIAIGLLVTLLVHPRF